jgi:VWFA-related protein
MRTLWFSLVMGLMLASYGQTGTPVRGGPTIAVPALVESKSGEIAYGLSAQDFSIKDDGIEQRVGLEDDANPRPLSLLLVIQTGHNAAAELGKIAHLDDLLDSILTSPKDQVAVIAFDSSPRSLQNFTTDADAISASLSSLPAGNSGSALFDAMHMAISAFRRTPTENRRVIVLISGEHDHGSVAADAGSLIRDVTSSDASIYSLSFRAGRKELLGKLRSLNPLAMTAGAMQKNAGEALAQLTGGEFYRFNTERNFEDHVTEMANHIHNRYSLSFHPSNPQPGFHSLQVEVRQSKVSVVSARSGYWRSAESGSGSGGGSQ